jgi:DNA-directed RNA polymerase subunit RPC12/RpoP/urease gamma subunit
MKPRTKLQHEVYSLSKNLLGLSKQQKAWVFKNALDHIGYRTKANISCLDCGHVWDGPQKVKTCKCPECGVKLTIRDTRKKKLDQGKTTVALLEVVNDYQVVRLFETYSYHKAGEKPQQGIYEIVQQWFKPAGKLTIVARMISYCNTGWNGDLEIRTNTSNFWSNNKYDLYAYMFLPESEVLPIYARNGWTNMLESIPPYSFLKNLLVWSRMETMVKAGQLKLAAHSAESKIWHYWRSIKICIRRKYIVKDANLWFDYLDLLSFFNKDLLNDKYVCPKYLRREHDRLVAKKNVILARQRREREIEQAKKNAEKIAAAEIAYKQNKGAFIGMVFSNGKLTVQVMASISEFMAEADAHKHCVFTNEYYAKSDSLIFSARIDNKPVETVELSLSKMKVVQSRGKGNNATEYNKEIVALVTKNIPLIRKKLKEVKTAAA